MSEPLKLECPKTMNITMADSIKTQFRTALDNASDVTLDLAQVEKVDTTALQLVYAFKQSLEQNGSSLGWENPVDVFVNTAKMIGIDRAIGLNSDGESK